MDFFVRRSWWRHNQEHVLNMLAKIFYLLLSNNLSEKDISLRMQTLRTAFSKLANQPSGSAAYNLTGRQCFILTHCAFLRSHVKSRDGISNYVSPTPEKQWRRTVMLCCINYLNVFALSKNLIENIWLFNI